MLEIQSGRKENLDDFEGPENRSRVKSISQRPPSYIDLYLIKDQLTTNENAQGHILISLADTFEAKKVTLSIIGELTSQTGPAAKKPSNFKRLKTSITNRETKVQRTFTTAKDPAVPEPGRARRGTRTLTRTFTLMNRVAPAPMMQNAIGGNSEMKNRELFCHYNIPLFTFKTRTLPAGVYRIPFSFSFPSKMLPTAEYNNDDQNFKFAVNYKIIAELEENVDEPSDFDKFEVPSNSLKSTKDLRIYKALAQHQAPAESIRPLVTEVSGKLSLPSFLCFSSNNNIKVHLKLQNTSFTLGEKVLYQLECHSKILKPSKTKVMVNIVEELNTFGNKRDVKNTPLDNSNMIFGHDRSMEIINNGGSVLIGEVVLPRTLEVTFRSPNVDIQHFFEVILSYSSGFRKQAISLRAAIVLKKDLLEDKDIYRPESALKKQDDPEVNEVEEDVMVLPLAKFKLDEKFNLLTKTAEMMNEMSLG